MKIKTTTLAIASILMMSLPYALADVEYRAIMVNGTTLQIVNTIPEPLPAGCTVINNGTVVIPGETVVVPTGQTVVLPKTLSANMTIKVK